MPPTLTVSVAVTLATILSGCLVLNSTSRVSGPGYKPATNRSLIIVGAGMEGSWNAPKFPISLNEYDMQMKSITGNCWRFNRVEAATEREIEYFVFDVAPGWYAGGGGSTVFRDHATPLAFEVPAGHVVYIGDFIYAKDNKIDLRYNNSAATAALRKSFPNIEEEPTLAKAVLVPTLQMFLCTP